MSVAFLALRCCWRYPGLGFVAARPREVHVSEGGGGRASDGCEVSRAHFSGSGVGAGLRWLAIADSAKSDGGGESTGEG
jgi:hypothetical protein